MSIIDKNSLANSSVLVTQNNLDDAFSRKTFI
jgi:hypothetical protein